MTATDWRQWTRWFVETRTGLAPSQSAKTRMRNKLCYFTPGVSKTVAVATPSSQNTKLTDCYYLV